MHLEATLEQVAPVRALTEVVGKSRERWPEVGPGGHAHERRGKCRRRFPASAARRRRPRLRPAHRPAIAVPHAYATSETPIAPMTSAIAPSSARQAPGHANGRRSARAPKPRPVNHSTEPHAAPTPKDRARAQPWLHPTTVVNVPGPLANLHTSWLQTLADVLRCAYLMEVTIRHRNRRARPGGQDGPSTRS